MGMNSTSMLSGCYAGVAGAGPGGGGRSRPQTKIFSHQCGGHLNQGQG